MAEFDVETFCSHLRDNVSSRQFGEGMCARHVRLALAEAGMVPEDHPVSAKDWGPTLESLGFKPIRSGDLDYQPGDIAVIDAPSGETHGHIAGWDGRNWISDFVQMRGLYPGPSYRSDEPDFVVYRHNSQNSQG